MEIERSNHHGRISPAILQTEYSIRWLDEFDIVHRPGVQHAVADYLSRLESGEAPTGVADDFPDATVLAVTPEE
jgi:hypothetical protein